ncbi:MAG: ABC transporter ATP-binding protein [Spirochaetes bacterium]|nr:ABC transporter ATP-binding protein [Spirochaetota bacterium]
MTYRVENLKLSYGSLQVLNGISAEFPKSSVSAILGPSGCGKTSFLNLIASLMPSDSGNIEGFPGSSFSYCFQEPRLLPWLSARGNILFALSGLPDPELRQKRTDGFLAEAGLAAFASAYPAQLSGGMKRRLALARAFAYPSDILLLDEAFSAVDLKLRIELMDLFARLWEEERRTTIMVTHEIQDALYLADRILLFSQRPAILLESLELKTPKETRKYGAGESMELGARLYRSVLA